MRDKWKLLAVFMTASALMGAASWWQLNPQATDEDHNYPCRDGACGKIRNIQFWCAPTGEELVGPSTVVAETCRDGATIAFGEFLLENNVWGAPNELHRQCIRVFSSGSFGWNWSRLSPSNDLPYYPELIYGKKPWRASSTTKNLPVALSSIESLELSLNVSMNSYGKYDLAFDLWIANDTRSGPEDITHEIMIWLVWTPGLEAPSIHGTVYDGYNIYHHRRFEVGTGRWRYDAFTLAGQGIPPRINISALLEHLVKDGEDLGYLASIELGNEVWSGAGQTTVNALNIKIVPMPATVGGVAQRILTGGSTLKYLYPATASIGGAKVTGVGYADPADTYAAAGFLRGAGGDGYVQGWDTSSSNVDLATGKPKLSFAPNGSCVVMTGGPAVHNSIKYYMDKATGADQSQAFFRMQTINGVLYYQFVMRATSAVIVSVPASDVTGLQRDLCLIQSFADASGRIIFIITGFTLKGTEAGSLWFVKNVMANPSAYTGNVYVIGWNDISTSWTVGNVTFPTGNNDTFVDLAELQKMYP